ncbi:NUDIX hydrolase [Brevibacillus sp. 179-C9.3 HS]|uniref:NUDIX hydrolase n=1 Tax=unclassified Brevibacillus TaxID=2684853 RepID=UPI0039A3B606
MFIVNVEGAVFHEDKWLIIERSHKEDHAGGTLSLVGGKAEREGNTLDLLERTVQREIFEEVGIEVKADMHYVYNSSFVANENVHVLNVVFLCFYENGVAYRKSPHEVEAVHWMTQEEIMNHPKTPPWTKESIQRAEALWKSRFA